MFIYGYAAYKSLAFSFNTKSYSARASLKSHHIFTSMLNPIPALFLSVATLLSVLSVFEEKFIIVARQTEGDRVFRQNSHHQPATDRMWPFLSIRIEKLSANIDTIFNLNFDSLMAIYWQTYIHSAVPRWHMCEKSMSEGKHPRFLVILSIGTEHFGLGLMISLYNVITKLSRTF